jgi:pimeloyl-ACP methyl ester carboxylesterase
MKQTFLAVTGGSLLLVAAAVAALIPEEVPGLPVVSTEVPAGGGHVIDIGTTPPDAKTVDGDISDWTGTSTGFGGTIIYSRGELIYQDHIFDSYGADDGNDVERLSVLDPLGALEPRTYRVNPLSQYGPGELGLPTYGPITGKQAYGDANGGEFVPHADLLEVRVAADADTVWLLVRTTTMTAADQTAILVLADTAPGSTARAVPFNSGLVTSRGDIAILLAGSSAKVVDLASGASLGSVGVSVATNPAGYVNAIEAAIPRTLVENGTGGLSLAVAAGSLAPDGDLASLGVNANVANVAFRTSEPVRFWWEKQQALALFAKTIDPFFAEIDLAKLESGFSQAYVPGTGYHDRIFESKGLHGNVSEESGKDGIFQHYGVYLPSSYVAGTPSPLQLWLHFRGGEGHTAATVAPRIMQDYGEDVGTIVVTPRGRGTSTWYVGKGHVDFLEVWDDVHERFSVDEDRTYVSGHSMGGWGTYLLTILYPDRFAAGMPVAGPVTQGAWTGLDFPGCDDFRSDDYTPCYVSANGSDPRVQHTRRLLENLRHVPLGVFQGATDELVPVSGVTLQVERLVELGYRHRYYLFPSYEHYSHPIVDEWAEGVRYMHQFKRNPNPATVSYIRDMPFERATETNQCPSCGLNFDFDSAYWMSELTPGDMTSGVARFDGRSLAIVEPPELTVPEAGGPASPGQTGPYVMVGLGNLADPLTAPAALANGFEATLGGAIRVRLDLRRMGIDSAAPVSGALTSDQPLLLRLDGFTSPRSVSIDGGPAQTIAPSSGVLDVTLPAGAHQVVVFP